MLIVQVCDFGHDGDAHYRLHDPSRQMGSLPGVTAVDCHFFSRHLPDLAELADVMVLQFVNDWDWTSVCLKRRAAGKLTIFEANDYFFDMQPWNRLAPHWHDRNIQELYLQLLVLADGVQTSTEELAWRWRERGAQNVAVFRNYLPEVPPLPPPPDRPLTIGWGGSPGHLADWYFVAPALQRWLDAHPEVRLAAMTDESARDFFRLPPERYRFERFGSLSDYLRFLEGVDIGIAPLLPTGYNRGRSDVKFLEYASRGVAGIYADLEPYRVSVIPGKTGLLYRTLDELIEQLDLLRTNAELRRALRCGGHEYAKTRLVSDHSTERIDWYRSLLKSPPRTEPLPREIADDGVATGGYIQLPLRESEQILVTAMGKVPSPETLKMTASVIAKHPRHRLAYQRQGHILNSGGDYRGAMATLERASQLGPNDPRTLSEIARTWFLNKDIARARQLLEQALSVNPHYLPVWQYLLRMFRLHRSPDGPTWAQRAEEAFPACYPVALLGAQTHPPERTVEIVHRLLDRHAPTLTPGERPTALAAFREAVLSAVKDAPSAPGVIPLLQRTVEIFPESAHLAGELGAALFRAGRADAAFVHQSRALALRQQSDIVHAEHAGKDEPLIWWFAQHIRAVQPRARE